MSEIGKLKKKTKFNLEISSNKIINSKSETGTDVKLF